ncbi:MAG: hypothetical protein LBQ73_07760 [Tannerellaceae bacterium]|jgi:hypothetical protein|nr:hypothetical protein [Tannerellaceae bacterium]
MKRALMAIMGLILFTACSPTANDDDANGIFQYEVNVSIDIRDVVKDLKDLDGADLFPSGKIIATGDWEGLHARIKFLIYNEDGSLRSEETVIVDDFSKAAELKKVLPGGDYTVVATADMVQNTGDKIDDELWEFENTSQLRNFKITDRQYTAGRLKALGVYKSTLNVSKAESLKVRIKPLGSLVTFYFKNVTYSNQVAGVYYQWNKDPDYYLVDEEKSGIRDVAVYDTWEVNGDYTGVYDYRYFLPFSGSITLEWAAFDGDGDFLKTGSTEFTVKQGENATVTVDVTAGTAGAATKSLSPETGKKQEKDARK